MIQGLGGVPGEQAGGTEVAGGEQRRTRVIRLFNGSANRETASDLPEFAICLEDDGGLRFPLDVDVRPEMHPSFLQRIHDVQIEGP